MTTSALASRIARFIDRCADGARDDATRDGLLEELALEQAVHVEPYRRYLTGEKRRPRAFALPALPTDVFRFARVASHPPQLDLRTFRTSGTTAQARGEHAFCDLTLYERAARNAASHALFPETSRLRLCIMAPNEHEAPDSSLSFMLGRMIDWFGTEHSAHVWREGALRTEQLCSTLEAAQARREPIALLGTSFAFVHAEDALGERRFQLPPGSRIMQTGGFKGRSRSIEPAEMLALLHARYGIPHSHIVQEYGMTELSSQMYDAPLLNQDPESPRRFWVPGWVRAEPIDPLTLEPTVGDTPGLLRIDDLANLGSVCAIQTSDLAQRCEGGIVLLGRAPGAVARGCSLAVEEWLDGHAHGAA
ncbi:MAG: acyl-protein synthetase [Polyangiales bacterium]